MILRHTANLISDRVRKINRIKRVHVTKRPGVKHNKKSQPKQKRKYANILDYKPRLIGSVFITLAVLIGISFIPFSHSGIKTEGLDYETQIITDPNIELGDTKINQQGVNGSSIEKYKYKKSFIEYLFGTRVPETQVSLRTIKQPINQVVANGTLRYQYMYCSNGSSRSYTDAQMKDTATGLTHKSPDYCAENNQGTETGLGNTPSPSSTSAAKSSSITSASGCTFTTLPYTTTYQNSTSLPVGQTQTVRSGMNGSELTCKGKAPLTDPPINTIIYVGTGTSSSSSTNQGSTSSNSNGISYSQATATCQSYVQNLAAGGTTSGLSSLFASCMHKYGY